MVYGVPEYNCFVGDYLGSARDICNIIFICLGLPREGTLRRGEKDPRVLPGGIGH